MYTIKLDGQLLWDPRVEELEIDEPKVKLEVNKAGSLTFRIYPAHPLYNQIKKLKSVIEVYQDSVLIFRGRPLDDGLDTWNVKEIICEGDLAIFNDSIVRPYEFSGTITAYLSMLITNHNIQAGPDKQFNLGNVTVTDPNNYIVRASSDYPKTWKEMEDKLLSLLGGYLVVRRTGDQNYIDYLKDSSYLSGQVIQLGENLLKVNQERRGEDIATAIIPIGAEIENEDGSKYRVDITSVNSGLDYVFNQEAVDTYGWIFKTVEFKDVTEPSNLLQRADRALAESILLLNTIELTAVDLSMIDVSIDEFMIFEYVEVVSTPHQLDDMYLIRKMDIDLANPENNTITVGAEYTSLTEKQFQTKKAIETIQLKPGPPGPEGPQGEPGSNGISVTDTDVMYYLSSSAIDLSGGSWSTTAPEWVNGKFIWTKTVTSYSNGSSSESNPVNITGAKGETGSQGPQGPQGATGAQGPKGDIGTSVVSVEEYYLVTSAATGVTSSTPGWTAAMQSMTTTKKYLWNYEVINFSDGSSSPTIPVIIGVYGNTGNTGAAGRALTGVTEHYLANASASGVTRSTPGWTTVMQVTTPEKPYLWNYETLTWSVAPTTTYVEPIVIGIHGSKGDVGTGIESITEEYYLSTSKTEQTDGSWVTTPPVWESGKYIWTRSKIIYSNPASTVYTTPVVSSEWEAVNELEESVNNLVATVTTEVNSTIEQTSESIKREVSETYTSKTELETHKQEVSTDFEQTKNSYEYGFNELTQTINNNQGMTDAEFELIRKYIRFEDGNIILGESGNQVTLKLENDILGFYQSGNRVAYLSDNKLYVTEGEFINSLRLGNFAFEPRSNGNLSFGKVV